jgi:formyl-CoA transferase
VDALDSGFVSSISFSYSDVQSDMWKPMNHPDTGAANSTRGPLSGIRVLELGTLIAGPFAGRLFSDYGADVIKVEHPKGGDPLRDWGRTVGSHGSLWSLVQGRGKRSIALDLHDPEAQQIVLGLARTADVLIENFRPGRLEEWGLGPTVLEDLNPRLVLVRISGFGQTGPLAQQAGFGTIAEAVGGLRYLTGDPGQPPTRAGLSLGDSVASLYAMIGALVALQERTSSGRGQTVDVALTESVFSLLEGVLPEYSYFGMVRERTGNIAHNSAPTNVYRCQDSDHVVIGANSSTLFETLMRTIGRPELAIDPGLQSNRGRVKRAAELDDAIEAWTSGRSSDDVLSVLREAKIPAGRINSIADIVNDLQFRSRDMLVEVSDSRLERPVLTPGVVPKLSRTPGRVSPLAPAVGGDSDVILGEMQQPATSVPRAASVSQPTGRQR